MSQPNAMKIGVATATIIGMNAMIGAGIFTAPAAMASNVGPAGILAYIFVVVAVWFMAQSLARLSALFPQEGSFYIYAKQWSGHTGGLIASGAYLLGLIVAMGLLSRSIGIYLNALVPAIGAKLFGTVALASLVILNMFGAVLSQLGQHILIICTVFPLLMTTILCFLKADSSNLTPFAPFGFGNVMKATRMVIFSFFGFESAASLFNIVENPGRNVPRALTYSISIVGIIYILFIASIIISTPLSYFTGASVPLTSTLRMIYPNSTWIIMVIHLAILSAMIGTVHSMVWGSSELLMSLARAINKPWLNNALAIHSGSNSRSVLLIGALIAIPFFTIDNLNLFYNWTATLIITAFILSIMTLLFIKEEWRSGQNIKTMIGLTTAGAILYFALEAIAVDLVKIF